MLSLDFLEERSNVSVLGLICGKQPQNRNLNVVEELKNFTGNQLVAFARHVHLQIYLMKKKKQKTPYLSAVSLGTLAGFRAFSALALVSHSFRQHPPKALRKSSLRFLQAGLVSNGLNLMAGAEMIGDKVPGVPDRVKLPSLLVRSAAGAVVGAAVARAGKGNSLVGALLGATSAFAATYGSFYLRLSMNQYLPNSLSGALEEGLVFLAGSSLPKGK